MDDEAHIGLVDAHAEGVGGRDDLHPALHPEVLALVTRLGIQTGMIEGGADAHRVEPVGDDLGALAVANIYDGTAFFHGLQLTPQNAIFVGLADHIIGHILAFETALEDILLLEAETHLYVIDHLGSSRGGQSQHWGLRHIRTDIGNLQIRRTEVITPLRDTVRLVDSQEADLHPAQGFDELVGLKAFGRDIEELQPAKGRLVIGQFQGIGVHAGIDGCGVYPFCHKMRHLVLHQGNERCDDQTEALHRHGRHLETDALAATRGQQRERVLPRHHRVHDVFLERTETGIAPILL